MLFNSPSFLLVYLHSKYFNNFKMEFYFSGIWKIIPISIWSMFCKSCQKDFPTWDNPQYREFAEVVNY